MELTGGADGYKLGALVSPDEYTVENATKDNKNTLTIHFKMKLKQRTISALKLHLQVKKLISAMIITPN